MARRPVLGGGFTGTKSEPGGQNTPRTGRFAGAMGVTATVTFLAQQVDQGDIFDDAADAATAVVTATGSGVEDYLDTGSGTVTASGSGPESYTYDDSNTATAIATGTGSESYTAPVTYNDSRTATATVSGSGVEDYTAYYSPLIKATPGLVSYWRLSDPSGAAIDEKDVSNGTYKGSVTRDVTGLIPPDTAAAFPGTTSDYVQIPPAAAFDTGAQISVEVWVKPAAVGVRQTLIGRAVGTVVWFIEIQNTNRLRWSVRDTAGNDTIVSSGTRTLVSGQTYHLVGTYDAAGTIKLYVNGVDVSGIPSRTPTANMRAGGIEPIDIGTNGPFDPFAGTIDEVALYGVALDAATVFQHYQIGTQELSDPAAFDSGSGTVTASGSRAESSVYTDARTATVTTSGTGIESYTTPVAYTDAASGTVTTSGTGTESRAYTDTQAGELTATGTATEAAAYADTSTTTATTSGTGTESQARSSTATTTTTLSGTGLDAHAHTDSTTGLLTATGTSTDSYLPGPTVHTDTGAGTTTSTGTGTDTHTYTDTTTGQLTLTGTSTETWGAVYEDTATGILTTTGTSHEDHTYTDTTLGLATLTGTGTDSTTPRQLAISTITLNQPRYNIALHNGNMATTIITTTPPPTITITPTTPITTSIQDPAPITVLVDRIT